MCAGCNSTMGFKRVMLNRLQIGIENKTLIAEMDENNDGNNDGNRKHTDFSIDKILSDSNSNNSMSSNFNSNSVPNSNLNSNRLYQQMNNEYYAYWNRRIYPPVSAMTHTLQQRSAFSPLMSSSSASSTLLSSTTSAQYEIMNLSLRMYDQQINLSDTVDRIRNAYSWSTQPIPPAKLFDPNQLMIKNSNNKNNNNIEKNSSDENNTVRCASNKFSIYQNLKSYGIDLTSLSASNVVTTAIKTEPININSDNGTTSNLACSVCNKVFENALMLDAHERTHKSPRYKCEECGKQFSQLRNYKYHRSVHLGTKEFAAKCPECDKLFNDKGYLSSHLKIHRNKKEYVCPSCPKSFNQRVAFNMHVRIHSGIKPHKCPEANCGKSFSRKMLLKQHLRTHVSSFNFNYMYLF